MEIEPQDFKKLHLSDYLLIDVREKWEKNIADIGGQLVPMRNLSDNLDQLKQNKSFKILYCHHGVRNLHAARYLVMSGVDNVVSLRGGIDAWAREVDPNIPLY